MKKTKYNKSENLNLTRRQVLLFELCMLAGGALFTLYLTKFFISIEWLLWILLVIPGIYICYVHFKQSK